MVESDIYLDIKVTQWPIIYCKEYNVRFGGLEKLHPFDAGKWGHIFKHLKNDGMINEDTVVKPNEAQRKHLLMVHTKKYLRKLTCSCLVALIAEVPLLSVVPNYFVQKFYLKPMRFQVGGSILAGKLALDRGYAINLGGGFHHCSANQGAGFCAYADITLLIKYLFKFFPDKIKDVMIIDLDAHQGNGYERDFINNKHVYILDVYNRNIYPKDNFAKKAISRKVELPFMTKDKEFLIAVKRNLDKAFIEFKPDLVVYNAGTDVFVGDPLGSLAISAEGIILRDEMVFRKCRSPKVPIVMLTSGGYLKETARIIADSIINLHKLGLIEEPMGNY